MRIAIVAVFIFASSTANAKPDAEPVVKEDAVLTGLDAYYRGRPGGDRLPPDRTALAGPGHSLLMTSLGPLDVLGEIEGHRSYAQLIDHTESVSLAGRVVRVLSLEMIVQLKRASSHPKDVRVLPILEAALVRAKR